MGLTTEELEELHNILMNLILYGDDKIVYTQAGDLARSILAKVDNEAKRRKLWWAR